MKPLMTHEIGSLAKPSWKVKSSAGTPLSDHDIKEAETWGKKLDIFERDKLLRILSKKSEFSAEDKAEILNFASQYATKLLEKAGIDVVWDGEQHRVEMYEFPVRRMSGFTFRGHVRSFDNKYYYKASCTDQPGFQKPFHVEEFERISSFATVPVKIPITGAYTIVDWSFDEHYEGAINPGADDIHKAIKAARGKFLNDVAAKVINPNLKALCDRGAPFLQIDEPAATTKRDEIPEFIESMKISIGDLAGKSFFSTHICFSDYSRLFPAIRNLEGYIDEVHFEYANRDSRELGVNPKKRVGYEILEKLRDTRFIAGVGVLDVHTDFIEPPDLIRDRILYAAEVIKDPQRIFVAPDCGLRTRTWEVAFAKLQNMVEGRNLAAKALGIEGELRVKGTG